MRFFAYLAMAATATASNINAFSDEEKEALFEVWTAQAESGEMDEATYFELAQALDGDMPEEWYAEVDRIADEIEIPAEFLQTDMEAVAPAKPGRKADEITEDEVKKIAGKMAQGKDVTNGKGNAAAKANPSGAKKMQQAANIAKAKKTAAEVDAKNKAK